MISRSSWDRSCPIRKLLVIRGLFHQVLQVPSIAPCIARNKRNPTLTQQLSDDNDPLVLLIVGMLPLPKKRKGEDTDEISFLKEELYKLKRRVRKLKDKERKAPEDKDGCSRGELLKLIELERNPYIATKTLLSSLFTEQELLSHSVSGKAPNSKIKAKPRFDGRKYSMFVDVIHEKFPTLEQKDITAKVQAVCCCQTNEEIKRMNATINRLEETVRGLTSKRQDVMKEEPCIRV